jgi:ABC-type transporter Mla subunit MlaD
MPKFTRRIKGNRKNRTYKSSDTFDKKGGDGPDEQRKGIVDIATDKIGDATSVLVNKAENIGLNALGLERINNENIDKIGNNASGVVSDVGNVVNKTSAAVIDNVNNVLGSEAVSTSVQEAADQTAEITGKLAEKFNNAMNNPEVKQQVQKAIENAAEIGTIVVKSSEKPFQEAVKVGVEAGTKALGAASAGIIKVGTDMMAAVPGLGAVIEVGKMLNDGSKAASAVVEAGSEAAATASDAFIETSENVKQGLKQLEEKKKIAEQISNRTTKTISQFENPLQTTTQTAGGRKTKRRLFKRKAKSKRVRFST